MRKLKLDARKLGASGAQDTFALLTSSATTIVLYTFFVFCFGRRACDSALFKFPLDGSFVGTKFGLHSCFSICDRILFRFEFIVGSDRPAGLMPKLSHFEAYLPFEKEVVCC